MALYDEMMGRSVGSIRGEGATPEYILVRVVAEEGTDYEVIDGVANYPDFRGLVMAQPRWTRGAAHPFDTRAKAFQWTTVEMRGHSSAIVRVNYRLFDTPDRPPTNEWLLTVRTAEIQQRVTRELPPEAENRFGNKPRGTLSDSAGSVLDADFWTRPARAIGMPQYTVIDERCKGPDGEPLPDDEQTFKYEAIDECGKRSWKKLRRIEDYTDGQGATIDVPAISLIWTRTVPNFHSSMIETLARFHRSVNAKPYLGAPPYHVIVRSMAVEPIAFEMRGSREEGRAYRVTVQMLWSDRPFVPHDMNSFRSTPMIKGSGRPCMNSQTIQEQVNRNQSWSASGSSGAKISGNSWTYWYEADDAQRLSRRSAGYQVVGNQGHPVAPCHGRPCGPTGNLRRTRSAHRTYRKRALDQPCPGLDPPDTCPKACSGLGRECRSAG
jgi:hypothetical protein